MHDRMLQDYGFGFTDLVKRPSPRSTDLTRDEPKDGVAEFVHKLKRYKPRFACFHGVTVGRPVQKALAPQLPEIGLGLQPYTVGETRIFVVPIPVRPMRISRRRIRPIGTTRWPMLWPPPYKLLAPRAL